MQGEYGRLLILSPLLFFTVLIKGEEYQGLYLGKFHTYSHQVTGEVYAVDQYTFLIKHFFYDGLGQDTFFWAGSTVRPSNIGFIVPDEEARTNKLQRYVNRDLTIVLPDNKKITSIRWLAVWDLREHSNFADIYIPEGFEPPSPQRLSEFSRLGHNVSSDPVMIIDSKTIFIPYFNYDGKNENVYFWVGGGPQPNSFGRKIPNEKGYLNPLGSYKNENITLELPGNLTVSQISWLSLWDEEKGENLGSIIIPDELNIPPSLITELKFESQLPNCEQLHRNLQLNWDVFGPQITFELSGQIDDDDYMSVGISGSKNSSQMIDADVVIAYVDGFLPLTIDYNITGKYPCTNVLGLNKGVCSDLKLGAVDNFQVHSHYKENGITSITFRRNLINTGDDGDKIYNLEGDTYLVWAIGKLNHFKEPGFHHIYPKGTIKYQLGRKKHVKNCFAFTKSPTEKKKISWKIMQLRDQKTDTFIMRVGPPADWKGYLGITGKPTPGVVWYVNGLLAPEIYVKRGKKYTFKVEGGNNPYNARYYHPLYITDDPHGGYGRYTEEQRQKVKVYAGVQFDRRGRPHPSAVGRLCSWVYNNNSEPRKADNFVNFAKFRNSLLFQCEEGEATILNWTPDSSVPDVVYYQSYTQRNMGWKIHVVDYIISSANSVRPSKVHYLIILIYFLCSRMKLR
ncbi:protein Skeletor, isoforms B/C-like [Centruroides vittatus]|uniref:protein Skeletor, isoforms B/C-like n=1 Tax=Centruroides vittatus TaxID=120091 RepID=UPI00350F72BB